MRFNNGRLLVPNNHPAESAAVALLKATNRCPARLGLTPNPLFPSASPPPDSFSSCSHEAISCSLHPRLCPTANTGMTLGSYPSRPHTAG